MLHTLWRTWPQDATQNCFMASGKNKKARKQKPKREAKNAKQQKCKARNLRLTRTELKMELAQHPTC